MPIIRRKRVTPVESTFGKATLTHEFYVKATHVQQGDVVVPPAELSDAMLRDLAITHPKEFRKAALERGLVELEEEQDDEPELPGDDEGDDDEEDDVWSPAQETFLVASAVEAVELVRAAAAQQNVDLIAQYAEAEESKAKPRKSVLEALAAAIGA